MVNYKELMTAIYMRRLTGLLCGLLVSVGCLSIGAAERKVEIKKPDVRLLIDISGSMKNNDPNNLRVPALQLVTNLLPEGAEAGVWAFGRYINMLVPAARVDSQWQEKATLSAKKINSAGLFTNIGGVLEKASYGWKTPNDKEKRSLILLTDGMVDISKDGSVNAKERTRILNEILPKLIKAKVVIHTVALSQNADHELLKALSTQTDGWYQAVESAEQLQRVFLKIFEQSATRDSLPLNDNIFNVDASIEEMTLLVFKQSTQDTTSLLAPDGKTLTGASSDGSVRWFTTDGYDLITIKAPQMGQWKIDANVDPDNRVLVVSNLGLNIEPVPNNLLAGEAINYAVSLLEDGRLINKVDFLNLVDARLEQNKAGQTSKLAMFFDSGSSQFKQNFFTDNAEGVLNLTLEIKSPTFERTRNHAVNIYGSPIIHQMQISSLASSPHILSLQVRNDIVIEESLKVNFAVTYPDGEKQYLALEDLSKPIELRTVPAGGDYSIKADIKGQSVLGRNFSVSPEPIIFTAPPTVEYLAALEQQEEATKVAEEEKLAKPEPEPEITPVETKHDDKSEIINEPPAEEEVDWMVWLYIGLGGNIFLGLLGFFGWKYFKRKSHQNSMLLAGELSDEDDDNNEDNNQ